MSKADFIFTCIHIIAGVVILTGCSFFNRDTDQQDTLDTETAINVSPVGTPQMPVIVSQSLLESPLLSEIRGPDFQIDNNIKANDTVVRGTGPANVKITLVDVSLAGEYRGDGVISEDGTFVINTLPIIGGNTLGILIADLTGSGYTQTDFRNNENYRTIPLIGFLVETYRVPKE